MKRLLTLFVCVVLASVMTFADTVYYGLSINGSLTSNAKSSGNVDGYDTYVAKPLLSAGDLVEVVSLMENNTRWLPTLVSTAELDNFWLSGDTALLCLQDVCYEFTIQLLNDDMSNSKLSIGTGSDCISESAYQTLYSYYYGAPAPSGQESSYTEGSVTAYFYSGSNDLIFKGGGTMQDYSSGSSMSWNQYNSQIQSVYMSGTAITYIGNNTFANCTQLTQVALPPVLTGIGANAFSQCSNLQTVTCDATTPPTIDATTFNADAIGNITLVVPAASANLYKADSYWGKMIIPNADSGNPDPGETAIASGNINDLAWQLFSDGRLIFMGDGDIPNYSSADEQPWAQYREQITDVYLYGSTGTVGAYAFYGCSNMQTITLSSATQFLEYYCFYDCTSLTHVTAPYNDVMPSAEVAFANINYQSITLAVPADLVQSYQGAMFWYEFNVVSMDGGGTPSGEVHNGEIGSVLWELKEGQLRLYGEGVVEFGSAAEQPWANYRDQIYKLHISDQVTVVGSYAFAECTELNEIFVQGEALDSIGMYAFANCTNLVQITIASEIVVSADVNAFSGVTTSNITMSMMEEIMESYQDGVWADMQKTPLNTQPEEVSGLIYENLYWSFNSSEGLLTIYGNGAMPDWIQSMAPWGEYLDAITQVKVGVGVTYVCNGAFAYCENITSVTVAFTVDSIGDNLFTGNNSPIQFYVQNMTPPGITENTFANVQGCVYVYCYESAYSAFENHPYWSQTCLGYDDDPHYEEYQLSAIYVNGTIISGFDPNLYNYDITLPEGSEAPVVTYEQTNADQVVTVQQASSASGTAYVKVAVGGTDMATYSIYFSVPGGNPQTQTISLTFSDSAWTFIMLPSALGGVITADDIVADGELVWARYNGARRATSQSGWELVDNFDVSYYKDWGHIVRAVDGTVNLTITLPENFNQGIGTLHLNNYSATHQQNANWNFVGNPYNANYDILSQLVALDIESPIAVWNGTGYSTYTPGIDNYVLQPFEPFFIQIPDAGVDNIELSPYYQVGGNSGYLNEGLLPGKFSVSANAQVQFSKGNLKYLPTTNEYEFAGNQWDYIGSANDNVAPDYNGYIDVYAWGTGDNPVKTTLSDEEYSTYVDWGKNPIFQGGQQPELWRTLTGDEWFYMFESRDNATQKYGLAMIHYDVGDTICGLVILPDTWELPQGLSFTSGFAGGYEQNNYLTSEWQIMEAAGAVFLPAAGYTGANGTMFNVGKYGSYWASTPADGDDTKAFYFNFNQDMVTPKGTVNRSYRRSVRLVRDVQ